MSSKAKTTGAQEDGKAAVTPKLRFPEFRRAKGWDVTPMGGLVNLEYGESLPEHSRRAGPIPVVGSNGVVGYHDEALIKGPAIVIGRKGSVGQVSWIESDCFPIDTTFYVENKEPSKNLMQFLHRLLQVSKLEHRGDPGAIPGLNRNEVHSLETAIPESPEQQKIAECLSSVDELIAAQARKLDALNTHKKGLMQQLFPREGETQPRLRFPEFRNAGEWIQKTLGDVSEVLMCKRIFAEETNPNGGVPFYKIGTLGGAPDAFISKELFDHYRARYNFPRKGEVLITCSGTVGKCLPYDGKDAYFQDSNIVWLDNPTGEVSNEFLLTLLSSVNWGRLNSTTITRIYGPDLRGVSIKYPEDEAEQQRIADCLSTLDDLITAQAQKLESLKTHKKGLMQQLFPSENLEGGSEKWKVSILK